MAATYKIEINDSDLRRKAAAILRALSPQKLLYSIGARHLKWINDNFKSEGGEPGGHTSHWAPLSKARIKQRRKRGGKGAIRILQDTGRLRQSFAIDTSPLLGEVTVGTSDKRAPPLHFGTRSVSPGFARFAGGSMSGGIPARPMLPRLEAARGMAADQVNNVYNAAVRDANAH